MGNSTCIKNKMHNKVDCSIKTKEKPSEIQIQKEKSPSLISKKPNEQTNILEKNEPPNEILNKEIDQNKDSNSKNIRKKIENPTLKPLTEVKEPPKKKENPLPRKQEKVNSRLETEKKEKCFLVSRIPKTTLRNTQGQVIVTIKETGEVLDKSEITMGYFHDHMIYYDLRQYKGKFINDDTINDSVGMRMGGITSTGMVLGNKGQVLGKIEENGSFRNEKFLGVGICEGEMRRMGMLYYFMYPELKNL